MVALRDEFGAGREAPTETELLRQLRLHVEAAHECVKDLITCTDQAIRITGPHWQSAQAPDLVSMRVGLQRSELFLKTRLEFLHERIQLASSTVDRE